MKKNLVIFFFIFCISNSYAQYFPYKAPSKNVAWLDSMKRIVKRGFVVDPSLKNNWKKHLSFVNTCVTIGRYYEWAYEKRYLKNMSKGIFYYKKVTDEGRYPDDEKYFKALAIRTSLFRKLENIYFKGMGVKQDRKYSMELALNGIGNNIGLYDFYSNRYYHVSKVIIDSNNILNSEKDSVFTFKINPFSERVSLVSIAIIGKKLNAISKIFKNKLKTDSLEMLIEYSCEPSMRGQSNANRILDYIKYCFVQKYKLAPALIFTNVDITDYESREIKFSILQKGDFENQLHTY